MEKCISRCRVVHEAIYDSGGGSGGAKGHGDTAETSKTIASGKVGAKSSTASAAAAPGEAVATAIRGTPPGRGSGAGLGLVVPARARTPVWMGVVDAALLSLLRGFSRAKRCSTEGRALMSMDLQARWKAFFMEGLGREFLKEMEGMGKGREVRIDTFIVACAEGLAADEKEPRSRVCWS